MMIKYFVSILFLCTTFLSAAQLSKVLAAFEPLVGRTWISQGTWGDGSVFKQELTFSSELEGHWVSVQTRGFIDKEGKEWGQRNYGHRRWSEPDQSIVFTEHDVFGGVTTGMVQTVGSDLIYQYEYGEGDTVSVVTEYWKFIDDFTYDLKIGQFQNKEWVTTYLEGTIKALPKYKGEISELKNILSQIDKFSKAYMRGDHVAISQCYTTNGKILPPGSDVITGRAAIANRWKLKEGVSVDLHRVNPIEIVIHSDTAYDYGYYNGRTSYPNGKTSDWKGKYVIIWKRVDNQWLIDIDIWNPVND